MRAGWGALILLAGCTPSVPSNLPMPGRLMQALTEVTDVEATASLIARGQADGDTTPLVRGDDGVSFSGFMPAEPGEYTLQVVFTGLAAAESPRLFLGRWTSDAFSVALGDSVAPVFSEALDVLGGPTDNGDPDGDRLANLDELLLGTDPAAADTDEDGVIDGEDCFPTRQELDPTRIASGGSALDCDADGARSPNPAYGPAGQDCDDLNPAVYPGAEDDCMTLVDEDCNPSTCPVNDVQPPTIVSWTPAAETVVGCHTRLSATLIDDGGTVSANAVLVGADDGRDVTLYLTAEGDDFTSPPLNQVAGSEGLAAGQTTVRLEAMDLRGNVTTSERDYVLQFDLPLITSMTPERVGGAVGPLNVTIEASATLGIETIELHRVKKSAQGHYDATRSVVVGMATASPAIFTVSAAELEPGDYLLFGVVRDRIGNEARPSAVALPIPGPAGLEVSTDFRCIASARPVKMPARVWVVGQPDYAPATMRELLPRALGEAQSVDSGTELVSIVAFGIGADGRVGLDDAASFSKRWLFGFRHPSTGRNVSVTWFTPAFPGPNPTVDPNAGNITPEVALPDTANLADSDAVAAAFAAQGNCGVLTGGDSDSLIYTRQNGQNVVLVGGSGGTWRATADVTVNELDDC
jgi:hypothetical protein